MASLELMLDGDWGEDAVGWQVDVKVDMHRLHYDQDYSNLIYDHINNSLMHLGKEVEELGLMATQI